MASSSSLAASIHPATPADAVPRAEFSAIDASARGPVIYFVVSALAWLLAGTVLALIASFKLHTPDFLGQYQWLTFGRIRSAGLNAEVYGWSTNAGLAVTFWLMARLSRTALRHAGVLLVAAVFWNLGVTLGVIGILSGDSTAIELLEMPGYATPLLFVAFALVGVWAIVTFRFRKSEHVYVSQWYLLAALFCFPWIYSIAQIMLVFEPARGTVQALVRGWYANNLIGLWFTPLGLAAAYYFIPKVLGKPIHSYYLSVLGFWSLLIFFGWTGANELVGGPVPAWVISAGVAASLMLLIPVVVTAINHHFTMVGSFGALRTSPTLRFVVFGAVNFTLVSLTGSAMALRSVSEVTHFTMFTVGHAEQGLYGFYAMVMFGAIYYILPRVLLKEWPSASLIRTHFWCAAIGVTLFWLDLEVGGWLQGLQMNDASLPFIEVVRNLVPFLFVRSLADMLLTVGHVAFAVNVLWMLGAKRPAGATAPTLFRNPPALQGSLAR